LGTNVLSSTEAYSGPNSVFIVIVTSQDFGRIRIKGIIVFSGDAPVAFRRLDDRCNRQLYTVNGTNLRFLTLTPTLSHRERELKEVAINGRSKYNCRASDDIIGGNMEG
jgi:hypothetical protein